MKSPFFLLLYYFRLPPPFFAKDEDDPYVDAIYDDVFLMCVEYQCKGGRGGDDSFGIFVFSSITLLI